MPGVLPHNEKAAATWGSGGAAYDLISETVADSIEHLLSRLDVRPGERALDLATGRCQHRSKPEPLVVRVTDRNLSRLLLRSRLQSSARVLPCACP